MVLVFIMVVCLGYSIYLKVGYNIEDSSKNEEKIYVIKDRKEKNEFEK